MACCALHGSTFTRDAARKAKKESPWQKSIRIQEDYARRLRSIAREVGKIAKAYDTDSPESVRKLLSALERYARIIDPWARSTAERMFAEIDRQDKHAWARHSAQMSRALRDEIENAPTGLAYREYLERQIDLITSLPLDAAKEVHQIVQASHVGTASRSDALAKKIMSLGEVTQARATLIARTEIARASSTLVMVRAQSVGVDSYIWRTVGDVDVRKSHREMNGTVHRWDKPPTLSDGTTTHAGMIYNCRCYPEPLIPDADLLP